MKTILLAVCLLIIPTIALAQQPQLQPQPQRQIILIPLRFVDASDIAWLFGGSVVGGMMGSGTSGNSYGGSGGGYGGYGRSSGYSGGNYSGSSGYSGGSNWGSRSGLR